MSKYVFKRYQNYQRNLKGRPLSFLPQNRQITIVLPRRNRGTIDRHWLEVIFLQISSLSYLSQRK